MKYTSIFFLLLIFCFFNSLNAQESKFNDRNNTVHGVYLGLGFHYGTIDKTDTYSSSFKVAYVVNQQLEIGFVGVWSVSDLIERDPNAYSQNIEGLYGGLYLEPILFSKSKVNLSFPLLIGGGVLSLIDIHEGGRNYKPDVPVFVVEPGANALYNISRYIQLEAGIKYRFSSRVRFKPRYGFTRMNGFSAGMGIKIGVFNMGRNRYKKT